MSSTIDINKICEWCGKEFIAHKCSTRFCSKRCSEHSYKALRRQAHVEQENHATSESKKQRCIPAGNYFSPRQCAVLLGIGKSSVYRCLAEGLIPCIRLKGKTLISRASIDKMFENPPEYIKREKMVAEPIEEFYTTKEILEKFGISNSWLFKMAKERNIPKTVVRGKTLWSRKHIDKALADKQPTETVAEEWYSVEEVCAKFNMSKEAVYRFVSERKIGKRKDKCKVFYSRRQFDKAMGIESELEPEYYTMPEAMARYNMTRDQISHYVRTHDIPRNYEGRYVRIDRKALDALFAPPKIG